jgi:hypothetical protein
VSYLLIIGGAMAGAGLSAIALQTFQQWQVIGSKLRLVFSVCTALGALGWFAATVFNVWFFKA